MNLIILFLLAYSSYTDLKTREISNWITLGLIVSGLLVHLIWLPVSWTLVLGSSVLSIVLYLIGFWSEADVKLAIGLAFWLPRESLILMLFFYFVIVLVMGVVWMIKNKSLNVKFRYPAGPVFLGSFCLTIILFNFVT